MLTCAFTSLFVSNAGYTDPDIPKWDLDAWPATGDGRVFWAPDTYEDLQVSIPLNDMREAQVTISSADRGFDWLWWTYPQQMMLRVWYYDDPVFWGPCMRIEWNEDGTAATVYASGPEARLKAHYVRLGDRVLNRPTHPTLPNAFDKEVPVDHIGLRWLRDCGNVGDDSLGRPWVPPLGIIDGFNDVDARAVDSPMTVKFQRGDEVFDSMVKLAGAVGGADFSIDPVANRPDDPVDGYYAKLHTYKNQGWFDGATARQFTAVEPGEVDPANAGFWPSGDQPYTPVVFQDGFGADNATVGYIVGEAAPVTLVHVLDTDGKIRVTRRDGMADAIGYWIRWRTTGYKGKNVRTVLAAEGDRILEAYAVPLEAWRVQPKAGLGTSYRYLRDYMVGSKVQVSKRFGPRRPGAVTLMDSTGNTPMDADGYVRSYFGRQVDSFTWGGVRITRVTLKQTDPSNNTEEALEVIADNFVFGTAVTGEGDD